MLRKERELKNNLLFLPMDQEFLLYRIDCHLKMDFLTDRDSMSQYRSTEESCFLTEGAESYE